MAASATLAKHFPTILGTAILLTAMTLLRADEGAPVTVATVTRGTTSEVVEVSGTATAERRSALSARTAGLVDKVLVDAGSRVKQGDVLIELDDALAELGLERAQEALKEARTRLSELQRLAEEGVKLAQTGGLPRTEAQARQSTLIAQSAAVSQLEVDVKEQAEMVSRHQLLAPFSGIISAKLTEVGEWVQTGVPVLDLVEVDAVWFDAQVSQERFASLVMDTPVTVRLDSMPDREFKARILAKVPVKDPVARTFLVRLAVDAPGEVMAPGVSGRAVFRIQQSDEVLTIPRDAIVRQPDGSVTAWVVNGSGDSPSAISRPIRIGDSIAGAVEILDGLAEGQHVVLRGNETLRENQTIRILNEDITE